MSKFYNPVDIYFETEGLHQFVRNYKEDIGDLDRVLVLTRGNEVHKTDIFRPLFEELKKKETRLIELALSNPDLNDILQLTQELEAFDYQFIIAIGGGSVLDVAKTLSALKGMTIPSVEALRNIIVNQTYTGNEYMPAWIGIPTTSGTGSEVTSWATIWDSEFHKKYSVTDINLYAKASILIPELTLTLPLKTSVVTGLDAICHATEAYWSVHTNPITRLYALEAIKRLRTNLPKLENNLDSPELRSELAKGSLYAGLAFSNTRTTACHSISYPLTLIHDMEHGLAASITLGSMLKINQEKIVELERLLQAFGVERVVEVEEFIISIYQQYDIPYKLQDYGVQSTNVNKIVDAAFTKGRIDNNPVNLSEETISDLLTSLI